MENKEVERRLNKLHRKVGRPILEFEREFLQLDISRISVGYNQLEKENAELIKQLQAKDKALDKACGKIAYDNGHRDDCTSDLECPATQYSFSPTICGEDSDCEDCCVKCWKEWSER